MMQGDKGLSYMENLIKRLEDTKLRVFYCPTDRENIEEAIKCLTQYAEVQKILHKKVQQDSMKYKGTHNRVDMPDSCYIQLLLNACRSDV